MGWHLKRQKENALFCLTPWSIGGIDMGFSTAKSWNTLERMEHFCGKLLERMEHFGTDKKNGYVFQKICRFIWGNAFLERMEHFGANFIRIKKKVYKSSNK